VTLSFASWLGKKLDFPEDLWHGRVLPALLPALQAQQSSREQLWEVVGGADRGGIIVRSGLDIQSGKLSERLSYGAVLKQEELVEELVEEHMKGVGPPPTAFDTLPFQLARAVKWTVLAIPGIPALVIEAWREEQRRKAEKLKQQEEWEEEKRAREEEKQKKKEAKAKRKTVYKEIADAMERTAEEVTKMAAKIKNNPSIVPKKQGMTGREEKRLIADDCLEAQVAGDDDSDDEEEDEGSQTEEEVDEDGYVVYGAVKAEEYVIPEEKSKKKTKGGKLGEVAEDEDAVWSQEQQRSLEQALTQFPKGSAERWDRIAGKVEGKSKEQCMARFKQLAEQVKRKKAEAAE